MVDLTRALDGWIDLIKALPTKREQRRFLKFCVVGFSGVLVNMAIFAACAEVLLTNVDTGPRNLMATSCAVIVSILTNFFLNDGWTWRDRRAQGTSMLLRLAKYYLVAGIAGFVQIGIQYTLSITFGLNAHLANFTGIGAGIFINFFVNNLWTFRAPRADSIDGAADALKSNTEHGEHHIALVPKTP